MFGTPRGKYKQKEKLMFVQATGPTLQQWELPLQQNDGLVTILPRVLLQTANNANSDRPSD
jgi:hypothetical protein